MKPLSGGIADFSIKAFSTALSTLLMVAILPSTVSCSRTEPSAAARRVEVAVAEPDADKALQFYKDVSVFVSRLPDKSLASGLEAFVAGAHAKRDLGGMKAADIRRLFSLKIKSVDTKGYRFLLNTDVEAKPADKADKVDKSEKPGKPDKSGKLDKGDRGDRIQPPEPPSTIVVYFRDGIYKLDLRLTRTSRAAEPENTDPQNVSLSLDEALDGITGPGRLVAEFSFDRDIRISCRLLEQEAPLTVAAFVSMARGFRFVRTEAGSHAEVDVVDEGGWVRKPWYDGLKPAIVAENAVVLGAGLNPGFTIRDEFSIEPRHDRRGLLTTIPPAPEAGNGAVGITLSATPGLDDVGTVFGICGEDNDIDALGRAVRDADANGMNFVLNTISFKRVE